MKSLLILLLLNALVTWSAAQDARWYVSAAAIGADNGQSWADAFTDLQSALALSQPGDSIWVATGTYYPTNDTSRTISFTLKSGVRLYGGFAGTETNLAERDWATHETLLSGDIGIPDDSTDNTYNILYLDNPDSLTVVDGFAFRFGNADADDNFPGDSPYRNGGALYIMGADGEAYPLIANCLFEYNHVFSSGGAVYVDGNYYGSVGPIFSNCTFRHNRAEQNGGGLTQYGDTQVDRPDLINCRFEYNTCAKNGGGLYYAGGDTDAWINLTDCVFLGNRAEFTFGGGAFLFVGRNNGGSKTKIEGCTFEKNKCNWKGAGLAITSWIYLYYKELIIDKCDFSMNSTTVNYFGQDLYFDTVDLPDSNSTVDVLQSKFSNVNKGSVSIFGGYLARVNLYKDTFNSASIAVQGLKVKLEKISLSEGEIYAYPDSLFIINSIFHKVKYPFSYGGAYGGAPYVSIYNVNIVNSHLASLGKVYYDGTATFTNCLFNTSTFTHPFDSAVHYVLNHCSFDSLTCQAQPPATVGLQ